MALAAAQVAESRTAESESVSPADVVSAGR
jgi:hypothetical protein